MYLVVHLFSTTLFISALLLFTSQPLLGRLLLPTFGGTSAVWTTCLLFYQGVLLLGYLYAHLGPRLLGPRPHALLHLVLAGVTFLILPFATFEAVEIETPVVALLGHLAATAFLPLFVLSASAPLLQRWFATSGERGADDPYFLYRASNLGSLAALVAYPFLLEPTLTLTTQRWGWMGGYGLLVLLVSFCTMTFFRSRFALQNAQPRQVTTVPARFPSLVEHGGPGLRGAWVLLAAVPSSWLMGATTQLTTDIAPVPLLWVAPLAVYLFSFVVAFDRRCERCLTPLLLGLPAVIVLGAFLTINQAVTSLGGQVLLTLFTLSWACIALHGVLARLRPASASLTEYYLWLAVGGFLGGLLNAAIAPAVFSSMMEYPLVQLAGCLLVPLCLRWTDARWYRRAMIVYPLVAAAGFVGLLWDQERRLEEQVHTVYRTRNFYGALRVVASHDGLVRRMIHGNVVHGVQVKTEDPRVQRTALWYFYPTGPAGHLFAALQRRPETEPVAIIGLGAGALAAYARPGQEFTFYELNPAVLELASRPALFSYLADCRGRCTTVLGDARLMLRAAADGQYGLIVIDAFNSDAIPAHLLTREAFELYLRKLRPGGALLLHITNDYVDLAPVLAAQAKELGLAAKDWDDRTVSAVDAARGKRASHWVVITRDQNEMTTLTQTGGWQTLTGKPGMPTWTDDFSSVFRALK